MPTIRQRRPLPALVPSPVVCARHRRLDPGRLERAVGLLLEGHPELGDMGAHGRSGAGSGRFVHLDLSASRAEEQGGIEEIVGWALGRCIDRSVGVPFVVAYLDPGGDRPGSLVLAGRRPAVSDERACAALSDALLGLYGDLTSPDRTSG